MIKHITFIDIETVPSVDPVELSAPPIQYFKRFAARVEGEAPELMRHYANNAALYAEHGKIVAISLGKMSGDKFYIKSIASRDEVTILKQAADALNAIAIKDKSQIVLCAHNGFEFDFPFLVRRCLINGIAIPEALDLYGKKPWDIPHLDTMKMWSGTAWNYKVSLELLAEVFGLPSPKEHMRGNEVAGIYYGPDEENALKQISDYCANDVLTLANVYSRMKGLPFIDPDKIEYL